jgi:predicted RNA-binding protein (TIGR00451 family)
MGAVPHICNGADVMAPGIVRFEGKFGRAILFLLQMRSMANQLAVGEALLGVEEAVKVKQGVVVKNVHFAGDRVWNFIKRSWHCESGF